MKLKHVNPWLCAMLLALGVFSAGALSQTTATAGSAVQPGTGVAGIFLDVSQFNHDALSQGDTWDYAWADDDAIYSFNCDGRGYGQQERNISFNKLTGDRWNKLVGSSVNSLDYGKAGDAAPNGSNWKSTGADSIDGVLYAFVANNWYGNQGAFGGEEVDSNIRQSALNLSLIKSTDKGRTWTRDAQANYLHPMWTSKKFSTAFFFKYGQDGGRTTQDDQDKYVYAVSNDGYWNCGSHFYLGRVLRSAIGNLNAGDWQYFSHGAWSKEVEDATPLPGFSNGHMKDTMGSPLWIAPLRKYVTVTWFDPGTNEKWHFPENVTFAFYQADHPWGPWSWIGEKSAGDFIADVKSRIHRWYGPSLSPKFITENADGSVTAILTFSGQTWEDKPDSLYKNNSLPVTFYTRAQPREARNFNDTDAKYAGRWSYLRGRGLGDYRDDVHQTTAPGASAEFNFTGRGIEALSEKASTLGQVEVFLDNVSQGVVSLHQDPMPLLYQVEFYRNMNLAAGSHSLRIVNRSPDGTPVVLDGFRVYGGDDFNPQATYAVLNRVTGNALTIRDGAATTRQSSGNAAGSGWQLQAAGEGWYRIVARDSGRMLGTGGADGRPVLLDATAKADAPASLWKISPVGNGTFSITNRENGLVMGERIAAPPQTTVFQLVYQGRDVQKWEIVAER